MSQEHGTAQLVLTPGSWGIRSLDGLSPPTSRDNIAQIARLAGVLAAAAGGVALIVTIINIVSGFEAPGYEVRWLFGLAAGGTVLALVFFASAHRFPAWGLHPVMLGGTVANAVIAYLHGPTLSTAAAVAGFMVLGLIDFLLFHRRVALAHVGFMAACYTVVLVIQPGNPSPLSRVLVATGVLCVSGLTVSWLLGKIQDLARSEREARDELELTKRLVASLRERDRIEQIFGQHVSPEVAHQALEREPSIGGTVQDASALFIDVIGSTALYGDRDPREVARLLTSLFDLVSSTVTDGGGWVSKFHGDGALCIFGAPEASNDHASRALAAARRLHELVGGLRATWPDLDCAIGVSSGTVLAGNVGSDDRYEYTLLGDPVNEAARLTDRAKTTAERVLASGSAVAAADGESGHWRSVERVRLRGRSDDTEVYAPAT